MRALVLLFGLAMSIPSAYAQAGANPAEQLLFQSVNQNRAEHGLPPLAWDESLARAARAHANRMSREPGGTQHQYAGEPDLVARASQAGAQFSKVSENIAAVQGTPADIARAWMNSPVHRENILDPQLSAVGVGVVEVQGTIYAVEDFSHTTPDLGRDEIEAQAQQALRDNGLKVETSDAAKQAARNSCNPSNTPPAGVRAVMQFDCMDLKTLPGIVLKGMPEAKQHTLAVGACGGPENHQGFTTYHVAVLMYSDAR